MTTQIQSLSSIEGFMPHGMCLLWQPHLLYLHVISDAIIALSYYSIPIALIYFVIKRKDLSFRWLFLLFCLFILACGTTHLFKIWTIWHPDYYLEGLAKAVTAAVSLLTAILLWPLIPTALKLPSPRALAHANALLQEEVLERQNHENQVSLLNSELEKKVEQRTLSLHEINQQLKQEIAERHQVELNLRESKEQLKAIVESAADGIITVDQTGKIESVNGAIELIFGFDRETLIGQNWACLFPDSNPKHHPDKERYLEAGEKKMTGIRREMKGVHQDGHEFPLDIAITEFQQKGRHFFTAIIRDITERKEVERSMARLAAIVTSTSDAILSKSLDGIITSWNKSAEQMFGYTADEMINQSIRRLIPPERQVEEDEILARIKAGENIKHYETVRISKNHRRLDVALTISPIKDNQGNIIGASKIIHNISDLKRAESALGIKEERLRLALEAGHMGTWDWHLLRGSNIWNDQMFKLLGYSPNSEDPTYEAWARRVLPEDLAIVETKLKNSMEQGSDYHAEYRVLGQNDKIRWLEARGRIARDMDGRAVRSYGVAMDITERKQQEKALKDADLRKNEFLAMLGHELRNPLTPINTAVEIMSAPTLDQETLDWIREVLSRNVSQMSRLVNDLLDVSRITRGLINVEFNPVDLNEILRECVESIEPLFQSKQQTFVLHLPDLPVMISGDRIRLIQVFCNLLNNAAKYTQDEGTIETIVTLDQTAVQVDVSDNGMGLTPQLLPLVFDLFMQGERTLARSEGGLGIGLTLVKRLVELHHGTIEAYSEGVDCGAKFSVRLPLTEQAHESGATLLTSTPSIPPAPEPLRILIIDDNRDVAEGLAMFFELQNTTVQIALNGLLGINEIEQFKPDIVILDIGMPDMDGFEVARRLRELPVSQTIKLIALSGYAESKDDPRAVAANFDIYLNKPPNLALLKDLLAQFKRVD